jgi:hypothetical protein
MDRRTHLLLPLRTVLSVLVIVCSTFAGPFSLHSAVLQDSAHPVEGHTPGHGIQPPDRVNECIEGGGDPVQCRMKPLPSPPTSPETPLASVVVAFDWSMSDRLGFLDERGVMKMANTENYHRGYDVFPSTWPNWEVTLDARSSRAPSGIESYTWQVPGQPPQRALVTTHKVWLPEGTHKITLTIRTNDGRIYANTRDVRVKDFLIVALGDSFASGQGNPDVPQVWGGLAVTEGPKWIDDRCARSAHAGPVQAAFRLEKVDPHSSVTLIFLACSGASMTQGIYGQYRGQTPGANPQPFVLPPQLLEARSAICPDANRCRAIDMMTLSIGGNDIGFSSIVAGCATIDGLTRLALSERIAHSSTAYPYCYENKKFVKAVTDALAGLRGIYSRLAGEIRNVLRTPGAVPQPLVRGPVFLTEYPDPTRDSQGHHCGSNPQVAKLLGVIDGLRSSSFPH